MANRYWIGNGGSWSDTAHWSTTSGGSGGASLPNVGDTAIFDTNSFSLTGQVLSVNTDTAIGSIASSATNSPTITLNSSLSLNGSADFTGFQFSTVADYTTIGSPRLRFTNATGTATLKTGGATMPHIEIIGGALSPTVQLIDACTLQTNGYFVLFTFYSVTLDFNGQTLSVGTFISFIDIQATITGTGTLNIAVNLALPTSMTIVGTVTVILGTGAITSIVGISGGNTLALSGSSISNRITITNNSGSTKTISNATLTNTVLNGTNGFNMVEIIDGGGNDWGDGGGGTGNPTRLYHVKVPPTHVSLP